MEYFPHSSARALVQKRVGAIGVIIPRTSEFAFQNPFYSNMLLGLSTVTTKHNYQLVLSINDQNSYVSLYQRRMVDDRTILRLGCHLQRHLKTSANLFLNCLPR